MYKSLFLACLAAKVVTAAENAKPNSAKTISGSATFNMRYIEADEQVEFIVTMKESDAYVGLVLGATPGMMKSQDDMVIFFAKGAESYYEDYISTGFRAPIKDNVQNLAAHPDHSVDLKDGVVTVFARRALDTGD